MDNSQQENQTQQIYQNAQNQLSQVEYLKQIRDYQQAIYQQQQQI